MGLSTAVTAAQGISRIRGLPMPEIPVRDTFFDQAKHFLGIIDQTPGQVAAAAERELIQNDRTEMMNALRMEGFISAGQAAYSAFQLVQGIRAAYSSHAEAKKWASGTYLTISISADHGILRGILLPNLLINLNTRLIHCVIAQQLRTSRT
jgi:hypothetical protein